MSISNGQEEIRVNGCSVFRLHNGTTPLAYLAHLAQQRTSQMKTNSFYVGDLSDVIRKYREQWNVLLPRVHPYYAVKCNDNPAVVAVLARLGLGFDCASKKELQQVLELMKETADTRDSSSSRLSATDRIVFANPCKKPSHLRYAAEVGVKMTTFDSEAELYKVKALHPKADLIVRLKPVDDKQRVEHAMFDRFGCSVDVAKRLVSIAKELGLNVIGVAFHVGHFCFDPTLFRDLIEASREVFDAAAATGYKFNLLDIGGGFYGAKKPRVPFTEIAAAINQAIDDFFADYSELRVIAEPGQFFVGSAFLLANNVICVKPNVDGEMTADRDVKEGDRVSYHLTMSTGMFSSLFPYSEVVKYQRSQLSVLGQDEHSSRQLYETTLWGSTCSGYDCVERSWMLPKVNVGDFIVFEDVGSYTQTLATRFNRMPTGKAFLVIDDQDADEFADKKCSSAY